MIIEKTNVVVGNEESLWVLFPLPSSLFFIEVLLLLPPVPHTTPSHASACPFTKGGKKRKAGEMEYFGLVSPSSSMLIKGVLMAPDDPSGISGSTSKWLFLCLYKRHR